MFTIHTRIHWFVFAGCFAVYCFGCAADPVKSQADGLGSTGGSKEIPVSAAPPPKDGGPKKKSAFTSEKQKSQGDSLKKTADSADALSGASMGKTGDQIVALGEDFDSNKLLELQDRLIAAERNKPVHVVRGFDPRRVGYELMNDLAVSVDENLKVLIKPNIGGFTWFKKGADNGMVGRITDPAFVEGIVDYLVENDVKNITIAESWGVKNRNDVKRMFRVSGYEALAKRHPQVRLVDMNFYGDGADEQDPPVAVPMPGGEVLKDEVVLPSIYVEHLQSGLVINVPKLKTHQLAVVSAGMKNLMGVVGMKSSNPPHRGKWKMHLELKNYLEKKDAEFDGVRKKEYRKVLDRFSRRISDLYRAAHPHLTLIDGVYALEGNGFDDSSSVPLGIGVGSYNTVFADVEATKRAGYWELSKLEEYTGTDGPPSLVHALSRFYPNLTEGKTYPVLEQSGGLEKPGGRLRLKAMGPYEVKGNAADTLANGGSIRAIPLKEKDATLSRFFGVAADRMVWFPGDWSGRALPPGVATAVACGYTDDALVFGFISRFRSHEKVSKKEGEVPDLFKGEVVEIFLDPDPSTPETYLELECDSAGNTLDLSVDKGKGVFDPGWDSEMIVETDLDVERRLGRILVKVPLKSLGAQDFSGKWAVNFFRTEGIGKGRLYMAWSPTGTDKPKFHVPKAFGRLVFEPESKGSEGD